MKGFIVWLCVIGSIALAHFFPQFEPVVLAAAWVIIVLSSFMAPVIAVFYIVDGGGERTAKSIKKSAEQLKRLGAFKVFRLVITVGAFAYVGMVVTAVFWFFAALLALLPGLVAKSLTDQK